jgi:rubrerythrin
MGKHAKTLERNELEILAAGDEGTIYRCPRCGKLAGAHDVQALGALCPKCGAAWELFMAWGSAPE